MSTATITDALKSNWISGFFETCQSPRATSDAGRLTVSIGESGTLKSGLAHAFLAEAFLPDASGTAPIAGTILFTSEGVTHQQLLALFKQWGVKPSSEHVLVRPVLPRFLSSNNLHFQLKLCIRHVKLELTKLAKKRKLPVPSDWSCIRLVIDNWNSILAAHTSLKHDPQLLQSLVALLRSEGVHAYIVATQPGSPKSEYSPEQVHDVSQLESLRIHTWPVDFFGDRRIAISSSLPGSNDQRAKVYELARDSQHPGLVRILQDFDIYEDLESGKAKRVDLKVKLYSGYHADHSSPKRTSASYINEVFALFGDLFPSSKDGQDVVSFESIERYDAFKEYIQNLESAKLSETLVFQVDEFWTGRGSNQPLADMRGYLDTSATAPAAPPPSTATTIRDLFEPDMTGDNFRVPLHKDFGLLLADRTAWHTARNMQVKSYMLGNWKGYRLPFEAKTGIDVTSLKLPPQELGSALPKWEELTEDLVPLTVGDVWDALCIEQDRFCEGKDPNKLLLVPSWMLFLAAARTVAIRAGKHPFDIDLRTSETLSSLMLEIWLSKVLDTGLEAQFPKESLPGAEDAETDQQAAAAAQFRFEEFWKLYKNDELSIDKMRDPLWSKELTYAIKLLTGFLPGRFREYDLKLAPAGNDSVAFRTWLAPAALCQAANRNLAPLRLPGRVSVRGDWYLGVARSSRSMRLAANAIDKLVSESMNLKRFRDGVGLPAFKLKNRESVESAWTTPDPTNNTYRRISLGEIQSLAPQPIIESSAPIEVVTSGLLSLYRSRIRDYDARSSEFFLEIASLLRTSDSLPDDLLLPRQKLE